MANRLLRSLAIKIGAGLATGFAVPAAAPVTRQAPNLTPILTRIEDIENRVARVELKPAPAPEEIEALGTLVSSQTEDIAGLRQEIGRMESRNTNWAEVFGQKVAQVEQQVPTIIEAAVNARMADLEQKLRGEFQEIHLKTVNAFAETIETRIVGRIAALENSLFEQSHSIETLREKSLKTDDNLQRLLEAVEKLCVRAETQAQPPVVAPVPSQAEEAPQPPKRQTFESHYRWALARGTRHSAAASKMDVEPEPELAFAGPGNRPGNRPSPSHRGMQAVGAAILGIAVLGLRFIR